MSNIFTLNDGTKELTIQNNFGEVICNIHIRPGDISIVDRYKELTNGFDAIIAPLKDVKLNNDGTSDSDEEWAKIKGVEKNLIDRLNTVFDSKDIGNLFEKRNAFSTIGGRFYVENVMDMLGQVVAQEMEEESAKVEQRISKYTKDLK